MVLRLVVFSGSRVGYIIIFSIIMMKGRQASDNHDSGDDAYDDDYDDSDV